MTKTQAADTIALEARVFVRKARRDGHANLIDADALWSAAQVRKLYGTDGWTIRKAARLTVTVLTECNELDLIDWADPIFKPLTPRWMR